MHAHQLEHLEFKYAAPCRSHTNGTGKGAIFRKTFLLSIGIHTLNYTQIKIAVITFQSGFLRAFCKTNIL
jgi:hypothetical protein